MNYQKLYSNIISKSIEKNRKKIKNGIYYERHHIIPKCLGGLNNIENLVLLTAKEHYICHKLLKEIYPNNSSIFYAFWRMCINGQKQRFKPSAKVYERTRKEFSEFQTIQKKGKKFLTKEHYLKLSEINKGNKYNVGRIVSDETKKRQSISIKKSFQDPKRKEKHLLAIQKFHKSNIPKTGKDHHLFGKKLDDKWKKSISESRKAKFDNGWEGSGKKVQVRNNNTNIIYNTIKEAHQDLYPNLSCQYFEAMLNGKKRNYTGCERLTLIKQKEN